jgi:hypothetical protein
MKRLKMSVIALGLATAFVGCAVDPSGTTDPEESTATSAVTVGTTNFVLACGAGVMLRTCDNPGGCATGTQLRFGTQVFVDAFDSSTKMAHITAPVGWVLADGAEGEVYLSARSQSTCN